jgi:hypothetical protein
MYHCFLNRQIQAKPFKKVGLIGTFYRNTLYINTKATLAGGSHKQIS